MSSASMPNHYNDIPSLSPLPSSSSTSGGTDLPLYLSTPLTTRSPALHAQARAQAEYRSTYTAPQAITYQAPSEVTGYETIFDELPRYEEVATPLTQAPREVPPPPYREIEADPNLDAWLSIAYADFDMAEAALPPSGRASLRSSLDARPRPSESHDQDAPGPSGSRDPSAPRQNDPRPSIPMPIPRRARRFRGAQGAHQPFRTDTEAHPYSPPSPSGEPSWAAPLRAHERMNVGVRWPRVGAWAQRRRSARERHGRTPEQYDGTPDPYGSASEESGSDEGPSRRERRM